MPNLWETWLKTAKTIPHKTVLIDALTGSSLTAQQFTEKVNSFSNQLPFLPHQEVAYALPNGVEWLTLFFALQKKRAIAVPLDATLSVNHQLSLAKQLKVAYLWQKGKCHPLKQVVSRSSFCCIKLTSGSTGHPKKIYCKASHLIADGKNIIETMRMRKKDINLGLIPLGHSYGLGNLVLPLMLQGTTLVLMPTFVPSQIPVWIRKFNVTVFPSVPVVFQMLNQLPSIPTLKPLRLAISAGAPLSSETARTFYHRFQIKLHNFYGSSETGGVCYDSTGQSSLSGRAVGKPLKRVKVSLLPNRRILVRSAAVANTSKSYSLPDLGQWNKYGEMQILGRKKTIANIGGKKVDPLEIENCLRLLPGVSEVWSTVLTEKIRESIIVAIESNHNEALIRHHLHHHLPAWKLPKVIFVTKQFPRNSRGKIEVAVLRQKLGITA